MTLRLTGDNGPIAGLHAFATVLGTMQRNMKRDAELRKKFGETSRKVLAASVARTKTELSGREYLLERARNLFNYANGILNRTHDRREGVLPGENGSLGRFFEAAANYFEAAGEKQSAMSCLAFVEQNYGQERDKQVEFAREFFETGMPTLANRIRRTEREAVGYEKMAGRIAKRIEKLRKEIESE
jgi:hypothetical protein